MTGVESLVMGEHATARLGRTTVHGRVVGIPSDGTSFRLVVLVPDGLQTASYFDCWVDEGWVFEPGTPDSFDGDTSPEALAAWESYATLPVNVSLSPWATEQDAFTAGFDLARKAVNA